VQYLTEPHSGQGKKSNHCLRKRASAGCKKLIQSFSESSVVGRIEPPLPRAGRWLPHAMTGIVGPNTFLHSESHDT
jgi:hypothetical protein